MKKLISLALLIILSYSFSTAQTSKVKKNPVGTWKFEAPYAPEGYSSGKITVALSDQKYSALLTFTGSDYKITGESVKFENDSLLFSVYLEGESISVKMKMEDTLKMTGKAVYSQGEITVTANREVK